MDPDNLEDARRLLAYYGPETLATLLVATLGDDGRIEWVIDAEEFHGADGAVVVLSRLLGRLAEIHGVTPEAVADDALAILDETELEAVDP